MKIKSYDYDYKGYGWIDINPRYIKTLQEAPSSKGKFFFLFMENMNGLLIDKQTYCKLSKKI